MEMRPLRQSSVPAGYKQTEVGMIPEDWEVVPLGRLIVSVEYGSSAKSNAKGHTPVLRMGNLQGGKIDWNDLVFTDDESEIKKYSLISGDVLFNRTNTIDLVGKTAIYKGERPAVFAGYLIRINAAEALLDSKFLNYVLNAEFSRKHSAKVLSVAVGQANINGQKLKSYPIPLPPTKAEQEAIAEALSDADTLIESLEQLLAKKRQLKQGAMQELLTGMKRLPGFSGQWEPSPLRKFVRQFIVPMRDKPKRFTGDIPWCRIEDFDGMFLSVSKSGQHVDVETISAMNLKVYPVGTLLVSCSADLGRCAIVARPLVSNQTFIGLDMDLAVSSNLFFYYFMTSRAQKLNNLSSGTTISYLSREQFEEFIVFVPLDKQEQTIIAAILSDMDAEIAALETKIGKARLLKQGMMQELLTGRIRLVCPSASGDNAQC